MKQYIYLVMHNKFFIVFTFFTFSIFSAQNLSVKQIDSLIFIESRKYDQLGQYQSAIEINKTALDESKKIGYKKGIAWAYYYIANSYCNEGAFDESNKYLKFAEKNAQIIKNTSLDVAIINCQGKIYNEQNFSYTSAIKKFKEAEQLSANIINKGEKKEWLNYTYKNLISSYSNLNKWDSTFHYMQKSYKLSPDAYNSAALAYYHLNNSKNTDSIENYLKITEKVLKNEPDKVFERSIYESQLGDYYYLKNDFRKGIEHYEKAIPLAKRSYATKVLLSSYQRLSDGYDKISDAKRSIEYLKKYSALIDSLNSSMNKNNDVSLTRILEETKQKNIDEKQQLVKLYMVLVLLLVAVFLAIFIKNKVKNEKLLEENRKIIQEKEETLSVNEELIHELERKVNEKFDEVVLLAKFNDPNFYVRFQEVYPNFQESLLCFNRKLTASDLAFCAYLYLDFQTKEIAEFTFKSIKTIQNKKSSLRKKLNISSSEDLYIWIKNIIK